MNENIVWHSVSSVLVCVCVVELSLVDVLIFILFLFSLTFSYLNNTTYEQMNGLSGCKYWEREGGGFHFTVSIVVSPTSECFIMHHVFSSCLSIRSCSK